MSASITLATWNLNNLHDRTNVPLRSRAPSRSESDFAALRKYTKRMAADVIAFQEVNGPDAAKRVFPTRDYALVTSDRFREDRALRRPSDRIYTGFALRRGTVRIVEQRSLTSLKVSTDAGRITRYGTDITFERDGQRLRLLVVHLKSGCFSGPLRNPNAAPCVVLAAQLAPLEAWIDARAHEDVPFAVLGDFNRAFDRHGDSDHFWQEINDSDPPWLKLYRLPSRPRTPAWRHSRLRDKPSLDHMLFDGRAWQLVDRASFKRIPYDTADIDAARGLPSDHCPLTVRLRWR